MTVAELAITLLVTVTVAGLPVAESAVVHVLSV